MGNRIHISFFISNEHTYDKWSSVKTLFEECCGDKNFKISILKEADNIDGTYNDFLNDFNKNIAVYTYYKNGSKLDLLKLGIDVIITFNPYYQRYMDWDEWKDKVAICLKPYGVYCDRSIEKNEENTFKKMKALIERSIRYLIDKGIDDIAIVVGYKYRRMLFLKEKYKNIKFNSNRLLGFGKKALSGYVINNLLFLKKEIIDKYISELEKSEDGEYFEDSLPRLYGKADIFVEKLEDNTVIEIDSIKDAINSNLITKIDILKELYENIYNFEQELNSLFNKI